MDNLSKKSRVCFVIPTLTVGGMERVVSVVTSWLSNKEDLSVFIVTYGKSNKVEFPLSDKITLIQPVEVFKDSKRIIYAFKRLYFLRKKIKRLEPCIIISFGEIWNSFVLLSLLGTKQKTVISDRCTPEKRYRLHSSLLRRFLYPKAWGIIAQTEVAKEIYQRKFRRPKYYVISNPIAPIRQELSNIVNRENIILSVGRLISTKNFDRLINLFAELKRSDWKLIIVGGDAQGQSNHRELKTLITTSGMEDNIELIGKHKDVSRFYKRAKIFAFTSSSEGFPNVVGEAMTHGLPVVAYDCVAGPSEMIIDGYNGYLVNVYEDGIFKERLSAIMSDGELLKELSNNAKESIKKFSTDIIGQSYYNLIKEVCEGTAN